MHFFSFFKTLIGQSVIVELKNDLSIQGTLHSVDQYLNIKLDNISIINSDDYPHLLGVENLFLRGSTVRYIHLPSDHVDLQLLQDATRRAHKATKQNTQQQQTA